MRWPLFLAVSAVLCVVLLACGSSPTTTPAPERTATRVPPPTAVPAPTPTRAVDPLPDSPAEWESWEKVKGDLIAMGLEPGEPFVGVFGGGTYDNVVAYALLFSCEEDGPGVGPTVVIREDWPLGFMDEGWEIEVSIYYEVDGEPGEVQDWTMTMDVSQSSVYYEPPAAVRGRMLKAMLTDGTRELFVWLNPDDERVVQMVFSTEGFHDVAVPVLERCGTEEQLALIK